jgi:hypothetical protein
VWPPSVFVEPGVAGKPKSEPLAALKRGLSTTQVPPKEKELLADALRVLFGGSAPLAQPVTADMKKIFAGHLKASCDDRALWKLVDDGLARVENAYDVHGLAIVLWRELTGRAQP